MPDPMKCELRSHSGELIGYMFNLDAMREHDQAAKAMGWDHGYGVGYDKGVARQSRDERLWLNPYRAPINESMDKQ